MPDGKTILTGWNDNKIRAFLPQSGKLKFEINNAHNKVCAIQLTVLNDVFNYENKSESSPRYKLKLILGMLI